MQCTLSAELTVGVVPLSGSGLDPAQLSERGDKIHVSIITCRDDMLLWVRPRAMLMVYLGCPPSPRSAQHRAPSIGPARSSCLCCSSGTRSSWKTRHAAKLSKHFGRRRPAGSSSGHGRTNELCHAKSYRIGRSAEDSDNDLSGRFESIFLCTLRLKSCTI